MFLGRNFRFRCSSRSVAHKPKPLNIIITSRSQIQAKHSHSIHVRATASVESQPAAVNEDAFVDAPYASMDQAEEEEQRSRELHALIDLLPSTVKSLLLEHPDMSQVHPDLSPLKCQISKASVIDMLSLITVQPEGLCGSCCQEWADRGYMQPATMPTHDMPCVLLCLCISASDQLLGPPLELCCFMPIRPPPCLTPLTHVLAVDRGCHGPGPAPSCEVPIRRNSAQ